MGVLTGFLSGHEKTSIKEGKFSSFFVKTSGGAYSRYKSPYATRNLTKEFHIKKSTSRNLLKEAISKNHLD